MPTERVDLISRPRTVWGAARETPVHQTASPSPPLPLPLPPLGESRPQASPTSLRSPERQVPFNSINNKKPAHYHRGIKAVAVRGSRSEGGLAGRGGEAHDFWNLKEARVCRRGEAGLGSLQRERRCSTGRRAALQIPTSFPPKSSLFWQFRTSRGCFSTLEVISPLLFFLSPAFLLLWFLRWLKFFDG